VPGFKKTMYIYYTRKPLLAEGSEVFEGVARILEGACGIAPVERRPLPEEPDMLYLMVGDQRAGVFVRNSGTEEKTGVNVRGALEDAGALMELAEKAVLYLAHTMKDHGHPMARAERAVLEALTGGPLPESALPVPVAVHKERLLQEMANKERVIQLGADGTYERTGLGARMLEAWS
jgi:hypothetical protein